MENDVRHSFQKSGADKVASAFAGLADRQATRSWRFLTAMTHFSGFFFFLRRVIFISLFFLMYKLIYLFRFSLACVRGGDTFVVQFRLVFACLSAS